MLVSMDVTSLYTNIPQEKQINIVCKTYQTFHLNKPPIPTLYFRDMLGLILKENSFHLNGKNYLQTHDTAMGAKMGSLFCQHFHGRKRNHKPEPLQSSRTLGKDVSSDVFSLWNINKEEINSFTELAQGWIQQFVWLVSNKRNLSNNKINLGNWCRINVNTPAYRPTMFPAPSYDWPPQLSIVKPRSRTELVINSLIALPVVSSQQRRTPEKSSRIFIAEDKRRF